MRGVLGTRRERVGARTGDHLRGGVLLVLVLLMAFVSMALAAEKDGDLRADLVAAYEAREAKMALPPDVAARLRGYAQDDKAAAEALRFLGAAKEDPRLREESARLLFAYCGRGGGRQNPAICRFLGRLVVENLVQGEKRQDLQVLLLSLVQRLPRVLLDGDPTNLAHLRAWMGKIRLVAPLDRWQQVVLGAKTRLLPHEAEQDAVRLLEENVDREPRTDVAAIRSWAAGGTNLAPEKVVGVLETTDDDLAFVTAAVALGQVPSATGFSALVRNLTRRAQPGARAALRYYGPQLTRFLREDTAWPVPCLAAVAAWALDRRDLVPEIRAAASQVTGERRRLLEAIAADLEDPDGPWMSLSARSCDMAGGN